ncbi:MAG: hypothetical protein J6A01_09115, partial [Proteobacteria bacterium]|nr:hypothetical protein [Pseudomonadota bacterium]
MKVIYAIYFIVLFLILGSYLLFMSPDNALRLHIATADTLSQTQSNTMMVWARDLSNGMQFQGYKLTAKWVKKDLTSLAAPQITEQPLNVNGEAAMLIPNLPNIPEIRKEAAVLEIDLYDAEGQLQKSGFLPTARLMMNNHEDFKVIQEPDTKLYTVNAPAAFMFNVPNDVWIAAFTEKGPYQGSLQIEQTFGPKAVFPAQINLQGIGKFPLSIQGSSDFKLTAGEHIFYASFVPNEKPLHAAIQQPNITSKDGTPTVTVTPVGGMPTITVDYFQDGAWLERQTIPPKQAAKFSLVPNYTFQKNTEIVYARVSSTSMGSPDSTQMFALIASEKMLPIRSQALFVIKKLEDISHPAAPYLSSLLETDNDNQLAPLIRNYALNEIAAQYIPNLEIKVKTETDEAKAFERRKARQKSTSNSLLILCFGVGIVGSMT